MTKAERVAMNRLDGGVWLVLPRMVFDDDAYCTPVWQDTSGELHWRTFRSIKQKGWIECIGGDGLYAITDAGRKALGEG